MLQGYIQDLEGMVEQRAGFIEHLVEVNQRELDAIGLGGQAMRYFGGLPIRRIIHDEKYIELYQYQYNKYDYFSYTPELYSFLATPSECLFRQNGRGRTQIDLRRYYRAGCKFAPMINRFAYYYNEYCNKAGMNIERFVEEFREINKLSNNQKMQIDHANNDIDNNCNWNLSEIAEPENGKKGKGMLLAEIRPPYYCYIVVMPDGDYRIEFGYIAPVSEVAGIIGQRWFVHCQTIKELNNFLNSVFTDFVSMAQLPPHLTKWGNPQYIRATYKDWKDYFAGNFTTTACAAERILEMDAAKLIEWEESLKWGTLFP